jgi:hypothetical protein
LDQASNAAVVFAVPPAEPFRFAPGRLASPTNASAKATVFDDPSRTSRSP